MERLQHLISKLQEQFEQKTVPSQMLITVQLIEAELTSLCLSSVSVAKSAKVSKVSVVMPSALKVIRDLELLAEEEEKESIRIPVEKIPLSPKKQEANAWSAYPIDDIPTLSQQRSPREINDSIGNSGTSLNDRLRDDVIELAAALKDSPVRELKKAIGVNDRYVFISELFRGDEVMYERSIKTINNFRILPEAEYWMERELKIKLGWDDGREITQHFYQLVRRRFS
jgi:hypothetical protein